MIKRTNGWKMTNKNFRMKMLSNFNSEDFENTNVQNFIKLQNFECVLFLKIAELRLDNVFSGYYCKISPFGSRCVDRMEFSGTRPPT